MSPGLLHERGYGESGDVSKWNRAIGPFYSTKGLTRRLGVDDAALTTMLQEGKIIALRTSDGNIVYPTRQFFQNEDDTVMVKPVVSRALQFLIDHEADFADIRTIVDENGPHSLLNEWTIAGVLLQPNEDGETLLDQLQDHLNDPDDESWAKLNDLDGIATRLRKVTSKD
ncbi:MAG: hypothetical protein UU23_C0001G0132 [Candidatus Curtissbacteria bacterium GW2011_GWA1_40_9]|uniref:Uncharacterized protein n=1 Tax=Candidatus Curtissbacteria bacterium GW2011_GWA1_40_9 TaxID=1618408 RepID=A0A0G0TMZ6_9BACT|nr:MAG: hypothetical protein UU23_C0001G0132 [Candidatus Curtissbacteria bacterium GW2011_GWA1_40_9]